MKKLIAILLLAFAFGCLPPTSRRSCNELEADMSVSLDEFYSHCRPHSRTDWDFLVQCLSAYEEGMPNISIGRHSKRAAQRLWMITKTPRQPIYKPSDNWFKTRNPETYSQNECSYGLQVWSLSHGGKRYCNEDKASLDALWCNTDHLFIASGSWFYWHVSLLHGEIESLKRQFLVVEFGVNSLKESVNDWTAFLLDASHVDFGVA